MSTPIIDREGFAEFFEAMKRPETDEEKIKRLEYQVAMLTAVVPDGYTLEIHDPDGERICAELLSGWPLHTDESDLAVLNHLRDHITRHEVQRAVMSELREMTDEQFEAKVTAKVPPIPELRARFRELYEQAKQPKDVPTASGPNGDTATSYL